MGHEDLETTNGYIKLAEDLSGEIGKPFAALPPTLVRIAIDPVRVADPNEDPRMDLKEGAEGGSRKSVAGNVGEDSITFAPLESELSARVHVNVGSSDPLERALLLAAEAGRFDVVAQLSAEIRDRRLAGAGIAVLPSAVRKKGAP